MWKILAVATVVGLLGAAGCQELSDVAGKVAKGTLENTETPPPVQPTAEPSAKTTDKPAPKPARKENFEGHYLTVWIDGKQTKLTVRKALAECVWTVDACSANPEVRFQMDAAHLGAFKQADVVINPIKEGKVDPSDLWQCEKAKQLQPDQTLKLDAFNHIANVQLVKEPRLPAGRYSFKVRVNGEKMWDRQAIEVDVK